MKLALLIHGFVLFTIICVALLPVASVAIAGEIANANNCELDEGSIHPCVINGVDRGETLYSMGVMGWLMLATIPLGVIAIAVYLVGVGLFYLIRMLIRRRRSVGQAV